MAAFGILPTPFRTTLIDSPGAAVIAAGANFMLSPTSIWMTCGCRAAIGTDIASTGTTARAPSSTNEWTMRM